MNTVISIYPTLEDYNSNNNPIPLSGAGFDGFYLETINQNGDYIIHFTIGGGDFYGNLNDFTLIPFSEAKAVTHYALNEGGIWTLYSAIDPLTSNEYEEIVLYDNPDNVEVGKWYYTVNNKDFYTSIEDVLNGYSTGRISNSSISAENYFQNLPFRSTSNYTTSDYKKYLESLGKQDSQYYGTNAFVAAQDNEYVNSLLLFAFANHESAYGTSTYSYRCNNFFGRGANDSYPDNACIEYGFDSAYDGIMAQAIFLQNNYFDVLYWVYNGTHFGDKTSGMNVKYASDVNWGLRNASHAASIDAFLGGYESGKYKIIKVPGYKQVYTNSSLSSKLKAYYYVDGSEHDYLTGQMDSSNSSSSMWGTNYVVTSEGTNYYEIQLDTPKNLTDSACLFTSAKKGAYPLYNGSSYVNVSKGVSGYPCDYISWDKQVGYISNEDVRVINDVPILEPGYKTKVEYYSNGKPKNIFYLNGDNTIRYATGYDSNGNIVSHYEYKSGTKYGSHGDKIVFKFYVTPSDTLKYAVGYNDAGKIIANYEYESGTKYGSHAGKIKYKFFMKPDDTIDYATGITNGKIDHYYEYKSGTKYGQQGKNMLYGFTMSGNYIDYAYRKENGKIRTYYEYESGTRYGSHSNKIKYKFIMNDNGTIRNAIGLTNGKIDHYYEYKSGTKYGQQAKNMLYGFTMSGNYIDYAYRKENGKITTYYEYESRTEYGSHGNKITYRFYIDGSGYIKYGESDSYYYYYDSYTRYGSHASHIASRVSK